MLSSPEFFIVLVLPTNSLWNKFYEEINPPLPHFSTFLTYLCHPELGARAKPFFDSAKNAPNICFRLAQFVNYILTGQEEVFYNGSTVKKNRGIMAVVVRFAPSPTGFLHIGGARTALFNWLYARHMGGKFLLRIEDTDRERSTQQAIEAIFQSLEWLGLSWDEPPVFQFAQASRHAEVARQLVEEGKAYYCYCSPEEVEAMRQEALAKGLPPRYNGLWRDRDPALAPKGVKPVIRFKAPQTGSTVLEDLVQGRVEIPNEQLDDMVLLRADGTPTYMLSVVVDDHDMGITHVIRGDDHLTNMFRQYHLYKACGWEAPEFAHIPLIHGPDGAKLSKRHGALGAEQYQAMGFLPEAMLNYLLRLGWAHGDDEIIPLEQAIEWFDIRDVGRSPARFDMAKLTHLNAIYLRQASPERLMTEIEPWLESQTLPEEWLSGRPRILKGMKSLQERAKTLVELRENALFYAKMPSFVPETHFIDSAKCAEDLASLNLLRSFLDESPFVEESALETELRSFCQQHQKKLGTLLAPARLALTGSTVSPSLFEIMVLLGKTETLLRIDHYKEFLEEQA